MTTCSMPFASTLVPLPFLKVPPGCRGTDWTGGTQHWEMQQMLRLRWMSSRGPLTMQSTSGRMPSTSCCLCKPTLAPSRSAPALLHCKPGCIQICPGRSIRRRSGHSAHSGNSGWGWCLAEHFVKHLRRLRVLLTGMHLMAIHAACFACRKHPPPE